MPTVKISEMYDMRTVKDKIGVIGVHTPNLSQISRRWLGLMLNYKYFRLVGCNVRMACASMLPADPLQIGVEGTEKIAPQDLMNPILYRAVTNDSWNTVVNRLYVSTNTDEISKNSIRAYSDAFSTLSAENSEKLYYALLSSPEWAKAMPQAGLNVNHLKPLVFPMLTQFGNGVVGVSDYGAPGSGVNASSSSGNAGTVNNPTTGTTQPDNVRYFRGHAQPMPRFPTAMLTAFGEFSTLVGDTATAQQTGSLGNRIPRTYVLCVVMPPGKLTLMYYRLIVDWYIEFSDICTVLDRATAGDNYLESGFSYLRSYSFPTPESSKESDPTVAEDSSLTVLNGDVNLTMEK